MTATERFKRLLADALERVCVLEEENEHLRALVAAHSSAAADDGAREGVE